ncbi:MAG: TatD family hydrolase, partial [Candidatus Cloacimonadaceae bacterium]|nr:TatD family hydrolase [Candidatus Cloacimonadaceae bacterium]
MSLIDAHCHLANLSEVMNLPDLMEEAARHGITRFVSAALRRSEVDFYLKYPFDNLIFSAGMHPNFDECDLDIVQIDHLAYSKRIWAVGEIGLDRGNPDIEYQTKAFKENLIIAAEHGIPAVLHIVGHQQQAYEILKNHDLKYLV